MLTYELTEEDRCYIRELGEARNNAKHASIQKRDQWNKSESTPHIPGLAAELAFAKMFGVPIDEKIHNHGDMFDFGEIEIRCSTWRNNDIHLKIKPEEYIRKQPMAYVLCRLEGQLERVHILGFITRADFDKYKTIRNYGYGDMWTVALPYMNDIDELVEIAKILESLGYLKGLPCLGDGDGND